MEFILVVGIVVAAVLIYKHLRKGQTADVQKLEEPKPSKNQAENQSEVKAADTEIEVEPLTGAMAKARAAAQEEPEVKLSLPSAIAEFTTALAAEQDPLQRHRLLSQITELTYKNRKDASHRNACYYYSDIHLNEFESIKAPLKEANQGKLPQVMTFQNYSNLLLEDKRFVEAIQVCQKAIKLGLDDKTQTGFEGRIERIKARQAKDKATA